MGKEELLKLLMDCGAIQFGKFTLASGQESDYYVDMKKAMTDPRVLKSIASIIAREVEGADRVGGMELGAIPFVVAVSLEIDIPYLMVRKQKKGHGTGRQVEGDLKKGDKVVMLEDVTTTGNSTWRAVEAVREIGGVIEKVVVIVDRQEGAADLFAEKGLTFVPLLVRDDLKKD